MKAQPGPMVSGRYFFPKAAWLWVKRMPAWAVMSRNVMFWACAGTIGSLSAAAAKAANFRERSARLTPCADTNHKKPCSGTNDEKRFGITWKPRRKKYVSKPSCAGRIGDPPPPDPAARKRARE